MKYLAIFASISVAFSSVDANAFDTPYQQCDNEAYYAWQSEQARCQAEYDSYTYGGGGAQIVFYECLDAARDQYAWAAQQCREHYPEGLTAFIKPNDLRVFAA